MGPNPRNNDWTNTLPISKDIISIFVCLLFPLNQIANFMITLIKTSDILLLVVDLVVSTRISEIDFGTLSIYKLTFFF